MKRAQVSELDADLRFLETLRVMRAQFVSQVVDDAATDDSVILQTLRQESLYQLAEFFFAIHAYGVDSAEKIDALASLHNDHLLAVRSEPDRMRRLGLRRDRLEEALFTGDNLRKLVANFSGTPPAIDQSDLARFLVTVMSTETCRKLAVACERAGYLVRVRSPFGAVLVQTTGRLEAIFGRVLREARHALES
jgi:hypothetical protein